MLRPGGVLCTAPCDPLPPVSGSEPRWQPCIKEGKTSERDTRHGAPAPPKVSLSFCSGATRATSSRQILHSVALFYLRFCVIRHVGPYSRTLYTVLKNAPPFGVLGFAQGCAAALLTGIGTVLAWQSGPESRGGYTYHRDPSKAARPGSPNAPRRPSFWLLLRPLLGFCRCAYLHFFTYSPRSALRCAALRRSRGAAQLAGGKWV